MLFAIVFKQHLYGGLVRMSSTAMVAGRCTDQVLRGGYDQLSYHHSG
jgi:hypothetical protein